MKRFLLLMAGLLALTSFNAFAADDGYPDAMMDKMMAMKADAEVKKEMPLSVPGMAIVDTAQAFKMFKEKKAIFLDNRVKPQFDTERIAGAQWYFCDTLLNDTAFAKKLDKEKEYIVYCNGINCWRSPATAMMLGHLGFKKLYWYRDGLPAWKKAGHPVQ